MRNCPLGIIKRMAAYLGSTVQHCEQELPPGLLDIQGVFLPEPIIKHGPSKGFLERTFLARGSQQ